MVAMRVPCLKLVGDRGSSRTAGGTDTKQEGRSGKDERLTSILVSPILGNHQPSLEFAGVILNHQQFVDVQCYPVAFDDPIDFSHQFIFIEFQMAGKVGQTGIL